MFRFWDGLLSPPLMNLSQFLDFLKQDASFAECISGSYTIEAQEASYAPFPEDLSADIRASLQKGGIEQLYSHQAEAYRLAREGKNTVVVTPTASGKSLTYLLPIFQRKAENPDSRALLLFPTKALSQDQEAAFRLFGAEAKKNYEIHTYDGDTPATLRQKIKKAGDFIITNPDMLHAGILPHHTNWMRLFENLEFVVIDELHIYRGIFGSHVANVLRRLLRICEFYGSQPQFLCSSATIGNPKEHAEGLTGRPFSLIDKSGAPRGKKHIIFYNPPLRQKSLGIRAPAIQEAARLGAHLISNGISTILFCRSRMRVELLVNYLRDRCPLLADRIRSYRGGYLPKERRKIESELRKGEVLSVVSTNALELGVDIGMLEVSISVGYPGSISSLLQQFGRAGRRQNESLSVLLATADATDQYLAAHPDYFLKNNIEEAVLNKNNLLVVNDHIKCAAFELPFSEGESFGDFEATRDMLDYLADAGLLNKNKGRYHWMSEVYPANELHLRHGARENFIIIDRTEKGSEKVLGEMDIYSVPTLLHPHAVYFHQGVQFYVEELRWDDRVAYVRQMELDYFTDAQDKLEIQVLQHEKKQELSGLEIHKGEVALRTMAVMFKKIKLQSHESIGFGDIHLPELQMHTEAAWLSIPDGHPFFRTVKKGELGPTLHAVAYVLGRVAPLFVLCDPRDLKTRAELRTLTFAQPTVYFYDAQPGGMGLSHRVIQNLAVVAEAARGRIRECPCQKGCPACIGIFDEPFSVKSKAQEFLSMIYGASEK